MRLPIAAMACCIEDEPLKSRSRLSGRRAGGAGSGLSQVSTGTRIRNVVPVPGVLSTRMMPPMRPTNRSVIARPWNLWRSKYYPHATS